MLEDIHWADRSTRAFLVFLARSLWTERVLVIATYRSDELHRRHPLRPLLAELERDTRSRRIELARLTRDELGDLLADILGGAPDAELLERLYSRSEGNPLFTEELLAARLDGRGGLPSTLRDALMVRIERLSEPAQEVLRVLSAGRVLAHAVLAEASGLDAAELRAALREAAESNVIVADERGRYQFRHALLREVVHDDLLPGEHSELHLALARALEHQAAETGEDALITAGIAHHYLSAGAQREALVASVRAADAAERVHAHGEAGALLERALDLWPRVPDAATQAGCDRDELLRRAGRALINDGAYGRAEALLRVAVDDIDEDAEPRRAADLLELLSRAQWSLGRATDSRDSLDRAVALLPEDDRSPERARILARQAKTAMLQGRFSEALPAAEAAFGAASARGRRRPARRRAQRDGPLADPARRGRGRQRAAARGDRDLAARLRAHQRVGQPRRRAAPRRPLAGGPGRRRAGAGRHRVRGPRERLAVARRWSTSAGRSATGAPRAPALPPPDKRHIGMTLAYVETLRAAIALADAEHDAVRASLERVVDVVTGLARAAVPRLVRLAARRARAPLRRPRGRARRDRRRARRDRVLLRGPAADRAAVGDRRGDRGRRRPARPRPRRRRLPSARRSRAPRAS